jgi:DNA polymerase-3 subunit gamma/tau
LARASEGSMRDGLSLLDQIIAFGGKTIRHQDLETLLGAVPQERVRAMIEAVIEQHGAKALQVIAGLLDQGHDVRAYCADLVEYVRNMLVAAVVPAGPELRGLIEATDEDLAQLARDAERFTVEQVQELFRMWAAAEDQLRVSAHPRFVLETAAVRATRLLRAPENSGGSTGINAQSGASPVDRGTEARASSLSSEKVVTSRSTKRDTTKSSSDVGEKPLVASGSAPVASSVARPREAVIPRVQAPAPPPQAPAMIKVPLEPASQKAEPLSHSTSSSPAAEINWEEFQEAVSGQHPNIAPFLEMGRVVKIEGGLVTLGFTKQATVARSMLEKEDNLQALAALGERLYGSALRVRIIEVAEQDPEAAPTMKQLRVAKEQEQRVILTQQAKAHPLVKQALEMFGGELAEVRTTTPVQEVQE